MISVYITCVDRKEAESITQKLLGKKLAACVNVFPVTSFFLWKGKKEKKGEYALVAKTLSRTYAALEKEVRKNHSYSVPFISHWEEQTTEEVEQWLEDELA